MSEEQTPAPEPEAKVELSQEDLDSINKDLELAKNSLVSEEVQKKVEAAKAEVEEKHALAAKDQEIENLRKQLESKEVETAETLTKMNEKINSLIGSKAPKRMDDPFTQKEVNSDQVKYWPDEKVNELERKSAKLMLGDDFDERI
jgi:hypothetical protein